MDQWINKRLSDCLGFPVPEEMIEYILTSLKQPYEFDNYFQTLLNFEIPEHVIFLNDLKQRIFNSSTKSNGNGTAANKQIKNKTGDHKSSRSTESSTGARRKTKYVNLYSQDGEMKDSILLKGRHRCNCQATKHKLIYNCLECGRIVCEQEGSGPCLFCGSLVCSEVEQRLIESASKKGENLKKTLMQQQRPKGWEEAVAMRNRLLEYDRNSAKRTEVIDDESDYFKTNSVWLSDAERKKLKRLEDEMVERKHESRFKNKITFDFTGRQVIEESQMVDLDDEILKEIAESFDQNIGDQFNYQSDSVHPILDIPPPVFDKSVLQRMMNSTNPGFDGVFNRVQDKELLEISDMKACLSLHQPWASLLVAGIMEHEGRSWYSSHRGRLWIAATAKPVDMDQVHTLEHFYRIYHKNENLEFPTQYPSGCLLGCVSMQDCLPQEEYRKRYPEGESDSPFVFVCTNAQSLPIHFPIKGTHKIYQLDPNIHIAAVKSLQRLAKIRADGKN